MNHTCIPLCSHHGVPLEVSVDELQVHSPPRQQRAAIGRAPSGEGVDCGVVLKQAVLGAVDRGAGGDSEEGTS